MLFAFGAHAQSAHGAAQSPVAAPVALFEAYIHRDFDRALTELEVVKDFDTFVSQAKAFVAVWPAKTQAVFFLEAAVAALRQEELFTQAVASTDRGAPLGAGPRSTAGRRSRAASALFEAGTEATRRLGPTDRAFVAQWWSAAVSAMLGAGDAAGWTGGPSHALVLVEKFTLAAKPYLGDPALKLAHAVGLGQQVAQLTQYDAPTLQGHRVIGDVLASQQILGRRERLISAALEDLDSAARDPQLLTETVVRKGWLLVQSGEASRRATGLSLLRSVAEDPSTPDMTFVTKLILARESTEPNAQRRFVEAAQRLRPDAQSAAIGVAVSQYLAGDTRAAGEQVEAAISGTTADADPWSAFVYGDFHQWPTKLRALRALTAEDK